MMLEVLTPERALAVMEGAFSDLRTPLENVPLVEAHGRVLGADVAAAEHVPGFDRSTVDGYAVRARDTFGCSDSLPAILTLAGDVRMGQEAGPGLSPDTCVRIPTGGALPAGADAVVMVEYTEDYGDGTVGILRSAAPGENLILKGDDVKPGQAVLPAGKRLLSHDIGALAALGICSVAVRKRPVAGVLSTGDELVSPEQAPGGGEVRDVNGPMLCAALTEWGCEARYAGIVRDEDTLLESAVGSLAAQCDLLLLSGGSSVGEKDAACRVVERLGELLFHGVAMKPGKPTLLGKVKGKPVLGLPGHPAAAYFAAQLFVRPLAAMLVGQRTRTVQLPAELTEAVNANHGRAQYTGVRLERSGGRLLAHPIHTKSGLITSLAGTDGYFCVPRDCEGLSAGSQVSVILS